MLTNTANMIYVPDGIESVILICIRDRSAYTRFDWVSIAVDSLFSGQLVSATRFLVHGSAGFTIWRRWGSWWCGGELHSTKCTGRMKVWLRRGVLGVQVVLDVCVLV